MKKVFALPIIFVLAFCLVPVHTLAQGEGVIEGQVVNGTANGGSVEGLTVNLRVFADMEEQPSQTDTTDAEGWKQPYLRRQEIPRDPWGNDYVYRYPGQYNEHGYDLSSYGPDGKQGGGDDIVNWSEERR